MASAAGALRPLGQATAFPVSGTAAASRIFYVTPETADFVKAGGLGDVSAALPRALRAAQCDVRILIPGYRQLLRRCNGMEIVGRLDGLAGIPPCDIGQVRMPDGLIAYIVLAPSLYDRDGTPYGNAWAGIGATTIFALLVLRWPRRISRAAAQV